MSIYKMSKIVLALLLAGGCLTAGDTGAARATDAEETIETMAVTTTSSSGETKYTYTFTPYNSSSKNFESTPVTAATASVTVNTTEKTYTYTDASGNQKSINYTTLTEAETGTGTTNPSVSVDVLDLSGSTDQSVSTDLSSLDLNYGSPNEATGSTTEKIYYAWTEDGFVQVKYENSGEHTGQYSYTVTVGSETTTKYVDSVNVTVSYVTNDENAGQGSHAGITNTGDYKAEDGTNNISADFVADHHHESEIQGGGAIYNDGRSADVSLGTITGNFIGNYESSSGTGNMEGGAITNFANSSDYTATIDAIAGNFVGNYVTVSNSSSNNTEGLGGAISNYGNATINSITGDFIGNHVVATQTNEAEYSAVAHGGAISNYRYTGGQEPLTPTIGKIEGNFIGNYVESAGGSSWGSTGGGAVYNSGTIGDFDEDGNLKLQDDSGNATVAIAGSFIGNYAKTTAGGYAYGGAIMNGSNGNIGNIQADFIGNYAEATASGAWGGAINNLGTIADVGSSDAKSNFIGNYVRTSGNEFAQGGAIYNTGTFGDITADFIGNSATTSGTYALGGAINNNNGTINSLAGDFIGNSAEATGEDEEKSYAWGGAIYNTGKITGSTITTGTTTTTTVAITGNFISNSATSQANDSYGGAIYNNGTIGTITTTESDGSESVSVTVDGISGSTFISNTAARGGAIYNGTDKTTAESGDTGDTGDTGTTYTGIISSITGTQFIQNVATRYGGAIYNYADGAIYNIAQNQFIENEALSGNGGAIENAEKSSYIGAVTENYFIGNKVTESDHGGGAIYNEGIIDSFSGNYFIENASGNFGGAIYNNGGTIGGGSSTGVSGNFFSENTSARGGAIYNTVARSTVSEDDDAYNYTQETFDLAGEDSTGTIMSITNNVFLNNIATAYGGAIYNYHGCNIGEISSNYFSGNESHGGNGGAVENAEFDTSIGTMSGNVFTSNVSYGNGGAIYNQGTIGIEAESNQGGNQGTSNEGGITGSIFSKNEAANGGAIYNGYGTSTAYFYDDGTSDLAQEASKVTGTSGDIKDDDGKYLYSIDLAGAGQIGSISGNYFEGNQALGHGTGDVTQNSDGSYSITREGDAKGGAIYNAAGTVTLSDGSTSDEYVCSIDSITGSAFYGNSAVASATYTGSDGSENGDAAGGAIYNAGTIGSIETTGKVNVSVTVTAGDSTSTTTVTNADAGFYNNSAKTTTESGSAQGGAIYNSGTIGGTSQVDDETVVTGIKTDVLSNNTASATGGDAQGGAIYNSGTIGANDQSGTVAGITAASVTSNSATSTSGAAAGGAIYNEGTIETIEVTDAISGNTATGGTSAAGGAIYNAKGSDDDASEAYIGSISVTGAVSGNSVKASGDNATTAYGGAIYNAADGTVGEIEITTLSGNTAEGVTSAAGGAIYNAGTIGESGNAGKISVGLISGNHAKATGTDSSATALGGAIYNTDENAEIAVTGTIASNYAEAAGGNAQGGAIYTKGAVTVDGTNLYIQQNYATASGENASAQGGAIYSEGTLNVTATYLYKNYAEGATKAEGGAIYHSNSSGSEEKISVGSISENYAKATGTSATGAAGGAIYNEDENAEIEVSGSIASNYAEAAGGDAKGGAIYTTGDVTVTVTAEDSSSGYIQNNYATATGSSGSAQGGAIYSEGTLNVTATSLYGNYATSTSGEAEGGAIYNTGALGSIDLTYLSGNYAEGATKALGGGIYNSVTNGSESGEISVKSISTNHATASGSSATAQGGAIYNDDASTTINVTGSIQNNYASAESGTAQGGAIYTTGDVNVTADSSTIAISGNKTTATSGEAQGGAIYTTGDVNVTAENGSTISITGNKANDDDNAIYMAKGDESDSAGTVNFSLSGESKIFLYDNIQGDENGYGVNISGDGLENVFYLLNDVEGSNLSVGAALTSPNSIKPLNEEPSGGDSGDESDDTETVTGNLTLSTTLHTMSDEVHTYKVNSFTVAGDFNMEADVDLKSETMDHFETTDGNAGQGTLTETGADDNGHAGNLNVSYLWGLSDTDKDEVAVYFAETGLMKDVTSTVSTLVAPVHNYSVAYVYMDGDEGSQKIHYGEEEYDAANSTVLSSSENGGYFVFSKSGFSSSVMTPSIAVMGAYGAFGMIFDYNFEHSDYYMKLPENVRLAMSEESENAEKAPKENDATRPEYYNQHELTYHGAWSRTFFSNESIDYGGGWDSRDKYYGAMFGFDTDMKFHDNGWANVTTGYVGTMGIRQQFSGGHIKQHGGFVGVTESFYKKNFYNAWTIAAGFTKAHEHTMYGHDKDRIDEYGIATRLGWNIRLGHDEKFTLLPTFTASFSYIHPEDFSNAANVHIAGSGFRAVQLNPNVKLLWNRDDGWQPYVTLGEVWTVADSLHLRANGEKLPELDLDPYTEYGIGIQKRWAYDKDAYIQFLGHSHGRDGFLINAGIRWNF